MYVRENCTVYENKFHVHILTNDRVPTDIEIKTPKYTFCR